MSEYKMNNRGWIENSIDQFNWYSTYNWREEAADERRISGGWEKDERKVREGWKEDERRMRGGYERMSGDEMEMRGRMRGGESIPIAGTVAQCMNRNKQGQN
jgi:hypothetical protein